MTRFEPLRCLVGPTAVGKSALALALCERTGLEIVSLDSMQVYVGLDVGTAKASRAEQERVRHHMLDLVGSDVRFDVQRYLAELGPCLADIEVRGRTPLFVGGTSFYFKALTRGLFEGPPHDPLLRAQLEERYVREGGSALHAELALRDARSAARIHANDRKRLLRALEVLQQTGKPLSEWQAEWGWHAPADGQSAPSERRTRSVGLECPTDELDRRIRKRTRAMLDAGWVEEAVEVRRSTGFGPTAAQALGYRQVLALADGTLERAECERQIALATRQFARRQRTWQRKLVDARFFPALPENSAGDPPEALLGEIARVLEL